MRSRPSLRLEGFLALISDVLIDYHSHENENPFSTALWSCLDPFRPLRNVRAGAGMRTKATLA